MGAIPGQVPGRNHIFRNTDSCLAVVPGAPGPTLALGYDSRAFPPDAERVRYFLVGQPTHSIHSRVRELLWELFPDEAEPDVVKISLGFIPTCAGAGITKRVGSWDRPNAPVSCSQIPTSRTTL